MILSSFLHQDSGISTSKTKSIDSIPTFTLLYTISELLYYLWNMSILVSLEPLGISKEEYEVYKLLLSKTSVVYTEIAKITVINRTSLYRIANSLD